MAIASRSRLLSFGNRASMGVSLFASASWG